MSDKMVKRIIIDITGEDIELTPEQVIQLRDEFGDIHLVHQACQNKENKMKESPKWLLSPCPIWLTPMFGSKTYYVCPECGIIHGDPLHPFARGVKRKEKEMIDESKVNLCESCKLCAADCPSLNVKFGPDDEDDNVIACDSYIEKEGA